MKIKILFLLALALYSCGEKTPNSLQTMLKDRPQMVFEGSDSLLTMASRMGGKWKNSSPSFKSCFDPLTGEISLSEDLTTAEAWECLFFEIHNRRNAGRFIEIYRRGVEGEFDRTSWVVANSQLEYEAGKDFLDFAEDTLVPFFQRHGLETSHLENSLVKYRSPFSSWIKSPQDAYPWNYWGTYYDTYLKKTAE